MPGAAAAGLWCDVLSAGLECAHWSTCLPPKSPKSPPVLGGSMIARRTPGTQCIAALMTRICYSKRMLSKISEKEEVHRAESGGGQRQAVPPSGVTRMHLITQHLHVTAHVKCHLPRKLIRDSVAEVVTGPSCLSAEHTPRSEACKRKSGVQHTSQCVYRLVRQREPLCPPWWGCPSDPHSLLSVLVLPCGRSH